MAHERDGPPGVFRDLGRGGDARDARDAAEKRAGALLALGGGQRDAPEAEVQPRRVLRLALERRRVPVLRRQARRRRSAELAELRMVFVPERELTLHHRPVEVAGT